MHAVLRRQLHCAKHYNRNLKLCRLIISKLTNNILFCSVISKCPAVTRQISTRYFQIEQAMVEERNHRKLMFYVSCTKLLWWLNGDVTCVCVCVEWFPLDMWTTQCGDGSRVEQCSGVLARRWCVAALRRAARRARPNVHIGAELSNRYAGTHAQLCLYLNYWHVSRSLSQTCVIRCSTTRLTGSSKTACWSILICSWCGPSTLPTRTSQCWRCSNITNCVFNCQALSPMVSMHADFSSFVFYFSILS